MSSSSSSLVLSDPKDLEIRRLRLQVFQLKNIIKKLTGQTIDDDSCILDNEDVEKMCDHSSINEAKSKSVKKRRVVDFNVFKRRRIALQICYYGWDYYGLAVQEITGKTIESELFKALTKTKLIESRESCRYARCGRTDKGVSSFGQIVSIDVRSNLKSGDGVFEQETYKGEGEGRVDGGGAEAERAEIDYVRILNANLPNDIQITAWAPCKNLEFSARFDCVGRTYQYLFPLSNLKLDKLNDAASRLVGEHDFRNFCKMDIEHGVVNHNRIIYEAHARTLDHKTKGTTSAFTMCVLTIRGKAFLWHQIRCIVEVLFRVGLDLEEPCVVNQLLDVESNPRRPQYTMASELPLNLFSCQYDQEFDWIRDESETLCKKWMQLWTQEQIKADMIRLCIQNVFKDDEAAALLVSPLESLRSERRTKSYIQLLDMLKCPSLEERLEANQAKRIRLGRTLINDKPRDTENEVNNGGNGDRKGDTYDSKAPLSSGHR